MTQTDLVPVRAGFVALTDCAPLIIAAECGFACDEGIDLQVTRQPSWAALRDKIAFAHLDCAAMLAGLPMALHLGLGGLKVPMLVPMTLGPGYNGITLSNDLIAAMQDIDADVLSLTPAESVMILKAVMDLRPDDARPLRLAMVYPWSCQNYELRHWLASGGIDPDEDIELVVIPPSRMVETFRHQDIDGFCVGEPWNQLAEDEQLGRVIARKKELFPGAPEKVLGLSKEWADENPDLVLKLVRIMVRSMDYMADPENRDSIVELLSREDAINAPADAIRRQLVEMTDTLSNAPDYSWAWDWSCPWEKHADWLVAQMTRWGQVADAPLAEARDLFKTPIFKQALERGGIGLPGGEYDNASKMT